MKREFTTGIWKLSDKEMFDLICTISEYRAILKTWHLIDVIDIQIGKGENERIEKLIENYRTLLIRLEKYTSKGE